MKTWWLLKIREQDNHSIIAYRHIEKKGGKNKKALQIMQIIKRAPHQMFGTKKTPYYSDVIAATR